MSTRTTPRTHVLAALVLATLAVGACQSRESTQTPGQQVDAAVTKAGERIDAAGADLQRGAERAGQVASEAVGRAGQAVGDIASNAGVVMADAAITSSIKVGLAADADLKSLDISVETISGHAVLRGTAPNDAARDRASRLASRVEGVFGVDNRLTVAR